MNKKETISASRIEGMQMPQAIEAENAVIGALLMEKTAFDRISGTLSTEMFYNAKNSLIYSLVEGLHKEQKKVDMLTVSEAAIASGNKEITPSLIVELGMNVVSSSHIEEHAMIVKEKYIRRKLIELSSDLRAKAYEGVDVIDDLLFSFGKELEAIQESMIGKQGVKHISDIAGSAVSDMYRRVELHEKGIQPGITTGLTDLNKITGGWQKSELVVLAARPAMGKSAIALYFSKSAARSGTSVALFSLEMSDISLYNRLLLSETDVKPEAFKLGRMTNEETIEIEKAVGRLHNYPIYIDDNSSVSMSYIRSRCRLLHKQGKCDMVIIDYLQLAGETGQRNRNREQEISQMSREAKIIAKELNIPVILLSQLNRGVEGRKDKMPLLSDLRESGAIEQDADMVIFIHRPEYYDKNKEKNSGELRIAKYRNGATGTLRFKHNGSLTKIFDYDVKGYSQPEQQNTETPF